MSDSELPRTTGSMPREINTMAIAGFVVALVGLCNPLGVSGLIGTIGGWANWEQRKDK